MNCIVGKAKFCLLLFCLSCLCCLTCSSSKGKPKQILWSRKHIDNYINDLSESNKGPYDRLVNVAEAYCKEAPLTIINKPYLPISRKANDYISLSTYAWPDTNKANGLPYVLRDGYRNPNADDFDFPKLAEMTNRIQVLGLAWYVTKKDKYAEKALEQIRVWFINKNTRMNPHMKYAQVVPGQNKSKGQSYGVIDGYYFVKMLDALILLEDYPKFKKSEQGKVKRWFADFLKWLTTSEMGLKEYESKNNHGTSYDGQVLAYSIYTGNKKKTEDVITHFAEKRLKQQIESDGSQPFELKRTRSFSYSVLNIERAMDFLLMAEFNGMPLPSEDLVTFLKSVEYLLPYTVGDIRTWPYKQVIDTNNDRLRLIWDVCIIATYLAPNHASLRNIERPNDDNNTRSIKNIVY